MSGQFNRMRRRLRGLFFGDRVGRELDEELEIHIRMRAEENVKEGMSPDDAYAAARRRFGNVGAFRDACLDFAGGGLAESAWQDVKFGARMLRRRPGFALVAVLTLALGVGANTAVFSVVNSVLLRPLPYPESDRLVQCYWQWARGETQNVSALMSEYWSEHSDCLESSAALGYGGAGFNLEGGAEPQRVSGIRVSEGFFRVLGVAPRLGRAFTPEEDRRGGASVAVITDGLWRRYFGGDPAVVGRAVRVNGVDCEIVGVMPPGFEFDEQADVFLPLRLVANPKDSGTNTVMLARLKQGVTPEQARADSARVLASFLAEYPDHMDASNRGVRFVPYHEAVVGDVGSLLLVLFVAAGMVLLVACANVASLLLARSTARGGEMAIRTALGAGGWRLARQVLVEGLLLAMAGSVAALVFAGYFVPLLTALSPVPLPRVDAIGLDWNVVAFAVLAGIVTSMLFGAAPALRAKRLDVSGLLRPSQGVSSHGATSRLRTILAAGEVALSFVLLVGASLLVESLVRLQAVDLGFRPEGLTTMQLSLNSAKYKTTAPAWGFEREVLARLETIPGVMHAAAVPSLPLERGLNNFATAPERPDFDGKSVEARAVSPGYFATLGMPVLRGRALAETDGTGTAPVVVVNESLARQFWPDTDPIGRTLKIDGSVREVVGLVPDIREDELDRPGLPTVYGPAAQVSDGMTAATNEWFLTSFVVRTSGAAIPVEAMRAAVRDVDPSLPVANVRSMEEVVRSSVATHRFVTTLLAAFAAIAVVLTAIGLYGVVSYKVALRTREIGIRLALGAEPRSVVALVLRDGMAFTVAGLGVGLVAALGLTQLISGFLFGVSATDPKTYVAIASGLLAIALVACVVPTRRAMRVAVVTALRGE